MENGNHPEAEASHRYGAGFCKINAGGFAKAAAGIMGLVYAICAIFVTLWPSFALQLLGWLTHLVNLDKFVGVKITAGAFAGGLAQVVIYSYVVAWLIAWLHNKFCSAGKN